MISGTGVDIVEIDRVRDAIERWGEGFLTRIFTTREIHYSKSRRFSYQHFAARFAAKEAVIKAFGEPQKHPLQWTDIEVLNDREGRPTIQFHNDALKVKKKKKIRDVIVSMSHSKEYAIANVILLRKGRA
ncbi:MAG: holo-ACP synthase [Candidatus Omnitrophica bacterium]|nr:holo-ACP synthase [Candidatus Omnitrophota bacterium]MCM8790411.1 holo-ACP synthase [Candidatus Omnitrophota bacterium]